MAEPVRRSPAAPMAFPCAGMAIATPAIVLVTVHLRGGAAARASIPGTSRIFDLWAYWSTRSGFDYASAHPGVSGEYLYSPAFAHLIAPLTALPLPVFTAVWTALLAGDPGLADGLAGVLHRRARAGRR